MQENMTVQAGASRASPKRRQLRAIDVDLSYVDQGTGTPVVFVHGAFSDARFWEPQRQAIASHYRFIAYDYRYHGTAQWPDDGEHYSAVTHAADLASFIGELNAGPAHLVGLSYGGLLVSLVASEHPELALSLTLMEPALPALLADVPEGKALLDERAKDFEPIVATANAGDATQATRLMFEWVTNLSVGALDGQQDALRRMVLDNARTVPLFISELPLPRSLLCSARRREGPCHRRRRGTDPTVLFLDQ